MDDKDRTTVHMFNLKASHEGVYECYIQYSDDLVSTVINLSVTGKKLKYSWWVPSRVFNKCYQVLCSTKLFIPILANYSKPQTTQECRDGLSCVVHCESHGGYPRARITWDVPDSHEWKCENNSEVQDPETLMVSTSSSAFFNCSSGEARSIRCCVGDNKSDHITVCKFWGLGCCTATLVTHTTA